MNQKQFFKAVYSNARKNAAELQYQAGSWHTETTLASIDSDALEYWVGAVYAAAMRLPKDVPAFTASDAAVVSAVSEILECKWLAYTRLTAAQRLAISREEPDFD